MSRLRFRDLHVQILLWTLLPVSILLIGFAFTGIRSHRDSMRRLVAQRDLALARSFATTVALTLENSDIATPASTWRQMLDAESLSEEAGIVVVDAAGQPRFRDGVLPARWPATWPGSTSLPARTAAVEFISETGGEVVVAHAPIANTDWTLLIREPWEPLVAPLLRLNGLMPLILLSAGLVSLLTLWFGVRYVVRPLQRLRLQAERIGQGDFGAAAEPLDGVTEIEELRRSVDRMAQQVRRYQESLQDYLGAVTNAQEEERVHLARELHDETVQSLVAISQRAQMIERTLTRDPDQAIARLAELRDMINAAIEEVRRFSRALRPLYLEELGLVSALETLARDAGAGFHVRGTPRRLSSEEELVLYRIAQEAINNARYHARAKQIQVEVQFREGGVTLEVRDDGIGFEVPERLIDIVRNGHYGLMGMYERVQRAGGKLHVRSSPGEGTSVTVEL